MTKLTLEEALAEIERLNGDLVTKTDAICNARNGIEKAQLMLGEWLNRYFFREKPTPQLAIQYGASIAGSVPNGEDSYRWFVDYQKIVKLIDIANDYVVDSKDLLAAAAE